MNTYASWWDDTITLYNKYTDPTTNRVKWYRHIIPDCFYKHTVERITVGKTTIDADVSICRIRISDKLITKKEWLKLTDEQRADRFTFSGGDIIVADTIYDDLDEYTQGKRSSDLIKEYKAYPGCFIIETVNINVGGGRGNEHYHVRGS